MAKIGLTVGFGLMLAVMSLVLRQPPADGPTATLADQVVEDPLYVIKPPAGPDPTMLSAQSSWTSAAAVSSIAVTGGSGSRSSTTDWAKSSASARLAPRQTATASPDLSAALSRTD